MAAPVALHALDSPLRRRAENEPLIRGDPPAGAIPGALGEPRGLLAALGDPPRDPNGEMPRLGELRRGEPCADADNAFVELPDRAVSVGVLGGCAEYERIVDFSVGVRADSRAVVCRPSSSISPANSASNAAASSSSCWIFLATCFSYRVCSSPIGSVGGLCGIA